MRFRVGIPARYDAQRLPGKPLALIGDKPMIQHVYEAALRSGAEEAVIATDDDRIAACGRGFGARICMTSKTHTSGTERLAEAAVILGWPDEDIVVNLQGDEPLMPADNIRQVAQNLDAQAEAKVATLCARIADAAELDNPHIVKVVTDANGFALYFSRACIPWRADDKAEAAHLRHIGLYAYRVSYLKIFAKLPRTLLETEERLEQLRALWHGARIHVAMADAETVPGVDTPEDLARVGRLFRSR